VTRRRHALYQSCSTAAQDSAFGAHDGLQPAHRGRRSFELLWLALSCARWMPPGLSLLAEPFRVQQPGPVSAAVACRYDLHGMATCTCAGSRVGGAGQLPGHRQRGRRTGEGEGDAPKPPKPRLGRASRGCALSSRRVDRLSLSRREWTADGHASFAKGFPRFRAPVRLSSARRRGPCTADRSWPGSCICRGMDDVVSIRPKPDRRGADRLEFQPCRLCGTDPVVALRAPDLLVLRCPGCGDVHSIPKPGRSVALSSADDH